MLINLPYTSTIASNTADIEALENAIGAVKIDENWNTAIGDETLYSLSTNASGNTAFGYKSLAYVTTGGFNTGVGYQTLTNINEGSFNIGMGHKALLSNINGNKNVALGSSAMESSTSGDENTFVGYLSGKYVNGTNNVGIGSNIHVNSNTPTALTGVTLLGANTSAIAGLSNATAVGWGAAVSTDNTIQLGNEDVTLVKTSGSVSATAFYGDASQLKLHQNEDIRDLVDIIQELTNRIETLEANSNSIFSFGFSSSYNMYNHAQYFDLENQNMTSSNDNYYWDLYVQDWDYSTLNFETGNLAQISILQNVSLNEYTFKEINSMDDIDQNDLNYTSSLSINHEDFTDAILVVRTFGNQNPMLRVSSNKYYIIKAKYLFVNNNGNGGVINLDAKEIQGSLELF